MSTGKACCTPGRWSAPPPLPALAERPDLPGDRLLGAILAGYEAMIRLGRALGPAHYAQFHNSSTAGGLGAVVAAGTVLGLTPDQMIWATGHCLSMAGGLWECRNSPTATKHLHVAEAARRGVQSALWARAGLVGPPRILEGPQGFFAGLAPGGRPQSMLDPAPEALIHQVSFKIWAACRHAHAGIDAVLAAARGVDPRTVLRAEVSSFADALLFCDRPLPASIGEAKFSLQHAVAVTLLHGKPALHHFEPPFLDDPAVMAMRARVVLAEDAHYTLAFPAHFGASVRLLLSDGTCREAHIPDAWGDRENPAQPSDVDDKFHAIAAHAALPAAAAAALRSATLALPRGACRAFLTAFAGASPLEHTHA
jgi:2-methylcitrate dehydratase PrpD